MKKLIILLCSILLLSGCAIRNPNSLSDLLSSSNSPDSSTGSNEMLESSNDIIEYNILGKYVCDSDYHHAEMFIESPDLVASITFYDDGNCKLFVNYLEGCCYVAGIYSIEGDHIQVELDFHGTIFEGTGTEYMDDYYIFSIISNDQIIIDNGFYTVNAGDSFIKSTSE